jgi:DNA-binding MarR family transcriptional regulator
MYDSNTPFPADNIRSLILELTLVLDSHYAELRRGTRYENLRKSDIKVFALASQEPRSMAALARYLEVSRQAVHDSVKRLIALDIVELVVMPNNSRDKVVIVTERGKGAQALTRNNISKLESACSDILGKEEFELLRKMLASLRRGLDQLPRLSNETAAITPPA